MQGSWNYRTMIGGGLGFALAPLLRRIHAGNPAALREAVERHTAAFNAHPYLSTVAIGALARLEHEDRAAATFERFRAALRGPLGALGDQAIWAGWRPLCVLGAIAAFCLGLDARLAAMAFVLVYNAGHVALRIWGLRVGWEAGLEVGKRLSTSALRRASPKLKRWNEALVGLVLVLLLARTPGFGGEPLTAGLAGGAALAGFFLPARGGAAGVALLFAACVAWWL